MQSESQFPKAGSGAFVAWLSFYGDDLWPSATRIIFA
jgi:hypothetical protein